MLKMHHSRKLRAALVSLLAARVLNKAHNVHLNISIQERKSYPKGSLSFGPVGPPARVLIALGRNAHQNLNLQTVINLGSG